MLVNTRILLFVIFAYPQTEAINDTEKRDVNLALETILEFRNNDRTVDLHFLDHVASFITDVKKILDPDSVLRRDFRSTRVDSFTGFVQELIAVLNTYEDNDLQDFIEIFGEEIRKYHYRGCKFHELIENHDIRLFVNKKVNELRYKPAAEVKSKFILLAVILNKQLYEKRFKDLMDFIDSLYLNDSKGKFAKVLNNFYVYKKSKTRRNTNDLVNIVRDGIRALIFDHYTHLNHNARRELKHKVETLWKQHEVSPILFPAINASEIKYEPDYDKVESNKDGKHSKPKYKKTETRDIEIESKLKRIDIKSNFSNKSPKTSKKKIERQYYSQSDRHKIKQIEAKSYNVHSIVPRVPVPRKIKHTTPKHSLENIKEHSTSEHTYRESHESNFAVITERESVHKYSQSNRHKIKQIEAKSDNVHSIVPRVPVPKKIKHTTPKHSLENIKEHGISEHTYRESHESNFAVITERESVHKYISLYPEPFITTKPEKIKTHRKYLPKENFKAHESYKPAPMTQWTEDITEKSKSKLRARHGVRHRGKKTHTHQSHSEKHKSKYKQKHRKHVQQKHIKKLSVSASHDNKDISQEKHESSHDNKQKGKKHDKKYLRVQPKAIKPTLIVFNANRAFIDVKSTSKYTRREKIKEPLRAEKNIKKTKHSRESLKPSLSRSKTTQNYEVHNTSSRNRTKKGSKKPKKKSYFSRKLNNGAPVVNEEVIKELKNIEKGIKDVKNRLANVKIVKDLNETVDNTHRRSEEIKSNNKDITVKDIELKSENKVKVKSSNEVKAKAPIHDDNVNKTETDNVNTYTVEDAKLTDVQLKTTRLTKDDWRIKLVNEDTPYVRPEVPTLNNYDEVDEWRDALKLQKTYTTQKANTVENTTKTLKTTTATTKTTETTTLSTHKKQLFIPVSVPLSAKTTIFTSKTVKDDNKLNKQQSVSDVSNKMITNDVSHTLSTKELAKTTVKLNAPEITDDKMNLQNETTKKITNFTTNKTINVTNTIEPEHLSTRHIQNELKSSPILRSNKIWKEHQEMFIDSYNDDPDLLNIMLN